MCKLKKIGLLLIAALSVLVFLLLSQKETKNCASARESPQSKEENAAAIIHYLNNKGAKIPQIKYNEKSSDFFSARAKALVLKANGLNMQSREILIKAAQKGDIHLACFLIESNIGPMSPDLDFIGNKLSEFKKTPMSRELRNRVANSLARILLEKKGPEAQLEECIKDAKETGGVRSYVQSYADFHKLKIPAIKSRGGACEFYTKEETIMENGVSRADEYLLILFEDEIINRKNNANSNESSTHEPTNNGTFDAKTKK